MECATFCFFDDLKKGRKEMPQTDITDGDGLTKIIERFREPREEVVLPDEATNGDDPCFVDVARIADENGVDSISLISLAHVFLKVVCESHSAVIDGWSLDLDGFEERLRAAIQKPGILPLAAQVERQIGWPGAPSDPVAAVRLRPMSHSLGFDDQDDCGAARIPVLPMRPLQLVGCESVG